MTQAEYQAGVLVVQVVRELHVVDWYDAEVERVPYRSINNYVVSSTKPRSVHHGIVGDDVFHSRMVAARCGPCGFAKQSAWTSQCHCLSLQMQQDFTAWASMLISKNLMRSRCANSKSYAYAARCFIQRIAKQDAVMPSYHR